MQLDLFDTKKDEEPLTLKQAIKNDPITVILVTLALSIFTWGILS